MKIKLNIFACLAVIVIFDTAGADQDPAHTDLQKKIIQRSLVDIGDTTRLENVLTKAITKEPLVISVIGGSITEGARASQYQFQYGCLVAEWFKENFPETPIRYINAGLGASSSNMGTHRVEDNLLKHKPDLVICEYAVNDNGNDLVPETMEGLVRQLLKAEKKPAVILLFMCGQDGKSVQEKHILVGQHYGLPMVSFRDAIYPEIAAGNIKWEDIEADAVHPNDRGHRYIADFVTACIQKVLDTMPQDPKLKVLAELPKPTTSNPFEYATMLCSKNSIPINNEGWITDDNNGPYRHFFGNGWLSKTPGSTLEFDIKGSFISMVYHIDKQRDYGTILVQVDDLDPIKYNAYAGWIWDGGMCDWKPIAIDLVNGWHKVKITLLEDKDKDSQRNRVRLLAVMAAGEK